MSSYQLKTRSFRFSRADHPPASLRLMMHPVRTSTLRCAYVSSRRTMPVCRRAWRTSTHVPAELSKEVVRARFSAEALVETSVEWRELRSQVQFLEDENRVQRRKTVDLPAANSKLETELARLKGDSSYSNSKAYKELQNETLENLKRRMVELDNELGIFFILCIYITYILSFNTFMYAIFIWLIRQSV